MNTIPQNRSTRLLGIPTENIGMVDTPVKPTGINAPQDSRQVRYDCKENVTTGWGVRVAGLIHVEKDGAV